MPEGLGSDLDVDMVFRRPIRGGVRGWGLEKMLVSGINRTELGKWEEITTE